MAKRLLVLTLPIVAFVVFACAAADPYIVAGIDGLETTCKDLVAQPEPAFVYFACAVVDGAGSEVHAFTVKVPTSEAPAFRAKMVRAPHVAPLDASRD